MSYPLSGDVVLRRGGDVPPVASAAKKKKEIPLTLMRPA